MRCSQFLEDYALEVHGVLASELQRATTGNVLPIEILKLLRYFHLQLPHV